MPVLPMVLVNGAVGIATAYSTNVPCYDPLDVVAAVRALIDAEDPAAAELPELTPWYRGFKGTIEPVPGSVGRWQSRGVVKRDAPTRVVIVELPIGYWTEDFKEAVEAFVADHPDVKGYSNASTDVDVSFTISFTTAAAADAWMAPAPTDGDTPANMSRLEAALKLVSNKTLSTTNMHLLDAQGHIRRYATPTDIIREYFGVRMDGYARRKEAQLVALRHDALVLGQKVKFLGMVVSGELELHRRDSGSELDSDMETRGLERIDGSYRYLTGMAMSSMTRDRLQSLDAELASKRALIATLEATTPRALWSADLDDFVRLYRENMKRE